MVQNWTSIIDLNGFSLNFTSLSLSLYIYKNEVLIFKTYTHMFIHKHLIK